MKEYVKTFVVKDNAIQYVNERNCEENERAEKELTAIAIKNCVESFKKLNISRQWSKHLFVFTLSEIAFEDFKKTFSEALIKKGVYDFKIIDASNTLNGYEKAVENKFYTAENIYVEKKIFDYEKNTYTTTETWETGSYTAKGYTSISKDGVVSALSAATELKITPETESETTKHVEYIVRAEKGYKSKNYSMCFLGVYTEEEYEKILGEINVFDRMPNRKEYSRAKKFVKFGETEYIKELTNKTSVDIRSVKITYFFIALTMFLAALCSFGNAYFFNKSSVFLLPWTNIQGCLIWGLNILTLVFFIISALRVFPSGIYYVAIAPLGQIIFKLLSMWGNVAANRSMVIGSLFRTIFNLITTIAVVLGFICCLLLTLFCLFLFIKSFFDYKKDKSFENNHLNSELLAISVIKEMIENGNYEKLKNQRNYIMQLFRQYNKFVI